MNMPIQIQMLKRYSIKYFLVSLFQAYFATVIAYHRNYRHHHRHRILLRYAHVFEIEFCIIILITFVKNPIFK
jgi:hypothetical protein